MNPELLEVLTPKHFMLNRCPWAIGPGLTVPHGKGTQHTQARFQAEHDKNAVGRTFTEFCYLSSGSLDQTSQLDAGHDRSASGRLRRAALDAVVGGQQKDVYLNLSAHGTSR